MNKNNWILNLKLDGEVTPLLRIFLLMRKFRVSVVRMKLEKDVELGECMVEMTLDFSIATRVETVFKKLNRFFDVLGLSFYPEGQKDKEIFLK